MSRQVRSTIFAPVAARPTAWMIASRRRRRWVETKNATAPSHLTAAGCRAPSSAPDGRFAGWKRREASIGITVRATTSETSSEKATNTTIADAIATAYANLETALTDQTILVVTVTDGTDTVLDRSLSGVTSPTLIMAGAHDRAIPLWQQEKLAEIFPNSRYELVPESGHVVYIERPDVFFPALKAFMAAKAAVTRVMELNDDTMYQTASRMKNRAHRAVMPKRESRISRRYAAPLNTRISTA